MAFKKAKAEQAALKVGIYGPPGSGKTFTTLLCAEGLAKLTGKRVAFVDTERGTDFYCQAVKERKTHPEAFDFDAIYTRSITEVAAEVRGLDMSVYGVIVIDSITHIWDAAKQAFAGRLNRAGQIPFSAWGQIKKPYKDLMSHLLSSPAHVFILGRQGNDFDTDEETGETKKVGVKMKAEGETAYEPHILIRMEAVRIKDGAQIPTCYAEKDRTGILAGKTFAHPTFETLIKPLLGTLGVVQAKVETEDEVGQRDSEAIAADDERRAEFSMETVRQFSARFDLAKSADQADTIGKEITADLKKKMLAADVDALREKYQATAKRLKGTP